MKISSIRYSDLRNFYLKLSDDNKLGIGSIKNINQILRQIFTRCIRNNIASSNPCDNILSDIVWHRKQEVKKVDALSRDQQQAFIGFVRASSRYRKWDSLFTVLLGTGMRAGEAFALQWEDCDFDSGLIYVRHNLVYVQDDNDHYVHHVSEPKTQAGIRTIPMIDPVRDALLTESVYQEQSFTQQPCIDGYSNFVFLSFRGNPHTIVTVDGALKSIVKEYNARETLMASGEDRDPNLLPHISIHVLRHTFCTRYCEVEPNAKIVQVVMGHTDVTTTLNIYETITNERKLKSMQDIGGTFGL